MTPDTHKPKTTAAATFVIKVAAIHVFTYILCGMIFSVIFNYKELMALDNAIYFYKQSYESIALGPLVQILRGLLFGLALLLFRNSYENKEYGWLRLWLIIVVIGIINTPAAAPCSIEGLIYTQLPIKVHINGATEILVQTLLFSISVATQNSKRRIQDRWRKSLIVSGIAAVGFSLSGIILSLVLGENPMKVGFSDPVAFVVMFIAVMTVFLMTLWYIKHRGIGATRIYYATCYIALAIMPTVYNICVASALQSYWSLLISALPIPFIAAYLELGRKREK